MKKRDLTDLKNKSIKELTLMAGDIEKSVTESRLELKLQKSKNVHVANSKRRNLAQVLTYLRQKQLEPETKDVQVNPKKGVKNVAK